MANLQILMASKKYPALYINGNKYKFNRNENCVSCKLDGANLVHFYLNCLPLETAGCLNA